MARPKRRYIKSRTFISPKYRRLSLGQFLSQRRKRKSWYRRRNVQTAGSLGIELKKFDTYVTAQNCVNTAAGAEFDPAPAGCLFSPEEGNQFNQREGRKVMMKSIEIRGTVDHAVKQDQADIPNTVYIRVSLVLDKQTNGFSMGSEDYYQDTAGLDFLSLRNPTKSSRFVTLWDRTFTLTVSAAGTDGNNTNSAGYGGKSFHIFKRFNIPVEFYANNGTIADITNNSLHMLAIANSTTANMSYQSRVTFVG